MYHPLQTWKTHLCKCDCESLSVSYLLPCYVYAKLRKGKYTFHFVVYGCIWLSTQLVYSCAYYVNAHACPMYEADLCYQLGEAECENHYMKVSSGVVPCVYLTMENMNVCTYENYECISPKLYMKIHPLIFFSTLFTYMLVLNLHYKLRTEIKKTQAIHPECDCLTVLCCPTCALAQEYREVL